MKKLGLPVLAWMSAMAILLGLAGCAAKEPSASRANTSAAQTALSETATIGTTGVEDTTAAMTTAPTTAAPPKTSKSTSKIAPKTTKTTTATRATTTAAPVGEVVATTTRPVVLPPTDIQEEPTLNAALLPVLSTEYYGLQQLKNKGDSKLLTVYYRLANAVENRRDSVVLSDLCLRIDKIHLVFTYYTADFPQHFWRDTGYRYQYLRNTEVVTELFFSYTMSAAEIAAAKEKVNAAAVELLEDLSDGMSAYERELAIHDRLIALTEYDTTQKLDHIHDMYGALVNRTAVCDGYSRAFQYLLYQAGIPCLFVTGASHNEGHAWNVACIDGAYYYVDVTWDDPLLPLTSSKPVSYANFNITTEQLLLDHTLDGSNYPLPDCMYTYDNYYYKNGLVVDVYGASEVVELIQKAKAAKETIVRVWISNGDAESFMDAYGQTIVQNSGVRGIRTIYNGQEAIILL